MIRLRDILLLENPDTLTYGLNWYNYKNSQNRSAFMVYTDAVDGHKDHLFGYSAIKAGYFCTNDDVMKDIEQAMQVPNTELYDLLNSLKGTKWGGGHYELEGILKELNRWDRKKDHSINARLFVVEADEDNDKEALKKSSENFLDVIDRSTNNRVICTFWANPDVIKGYKEFWDKAIKYNGYDPEKILYENNRDKLFTYFGFYEISNPHSVNHKPDAAVATAATTTADPSTTTDPAVKANIGSEVDQSDLNMLLVDKMKLFSEKRGMLHTTGASLSSGEKERLEQEVDSLEAEIEFIKLAKKLGKSLNTTWKRDDQFIIAGLKGAVLSAISKREKKVPYSLNVELEKQFPGMTIAQIRQKFGETGIPLRKLVKEMVRIVNEGGGAKWDDMVVGARVKDMYGNIGVIVKRFLDREHITIKWSDGKESHVQYSWVTKI